MDLRKLLFSLLGFVVSNLVQVGLHGVGRAQCNPVPMPGTGVPGVHGTVLAMVNWDPDGSGPARPLLVVGGSFTLAGDLHTQHLAALDPVTGRWSMLGTAPNGTIRAAIVLADGRLAIAGAFTRIGGVVVHGIAAFDGGQWVAPVPDSGIGDVLALVELPDRSLMACDVGTVKRWNGTFWLSHGGGFLALARTVHGEVLGARSHEVRRWTGSGWVGVGSTFDGLVWALLPLPDGGLIVGGSFSLAGASVARNVAYLAGSEWRSFGEGLADDVLSVAMTAFGLFAGGHDGVARWDGNTWNPSVGGGVQGSARCMQVAADGSLYVGGSIWTAGTAPVMGIARWDGFAWHRTGGGWQAHVAGLLPLPGGDLFAFGSFGLAAGVETARSAVRRDGSWRAVLGPRTANVNVGAVGPDGDVVISDSGTLLRWRGEGFEDLGVVGAQAVLPLRGGEVVVGGRFTVAAGTPAQNIARWRGGAWEAIGWGMDGRVQTLLDTGDGTFVAGGEFAMAGGTAANHVARWNGHAFEAMGGGLSTSPTALAKLLDGAVIACCPDASGMHVARWNGVAWARIGSAPSVTGGASAGAAAVLPNGDLVVGGDFLSIEGVAAVRLARWDGSTWSSYGPGLRVDGPVSAIAALPNGELVLCGYFDGIADANDRYTVAAFVASIRSPCAAEATPYGIGCNSRGGPMITTATAWPWLGETFRTRTTGIVDPALVLAVFGVAPDGMPLALLHPLGRADCFLWTRADDMAVGVPTGNTFESALFVPNQPALLGAPLWFQVVQIERDANTRDLTAISSGNALMLQLGTH